MTDTVRWPALKVDDWTATRDTLHQWLQIVGKVQLVSTPLLNQWWNITYELSARGLRTQLMLGAAGDFDAEFDLIDHVLVLRSTAGGTATVPLAPKTVAEFWHEVHAALGTLGVEVEIEAAPNEVSPCIPFADNTTNCSYDGASVTTYFHQLLSAGGVLRRFQASFGGKQSPVQVFWGSFDLSQVRYSGRPAPAWKGTPPPACPGWVMVEAEAMENSSVGFWSGGSSEGTFYAYAMPEPPGYREGDLSPAHYDTSAGEWLLPYESVRTSADPDATVMAFLQGTYDLAANGGKWDRPTLDLDPHRLDKQVKPQF